MMRTLRNVLSESEAKKVAIGHFNFSELGTVKAILTEAKILGFPVLLGTSEGEREFIGVKEAVALVHALREDGYEVYLNADHTHSFEKAKEAVLAGYDEILFDGGKLPLEENIRQTKEVVDFVRSVNPEVVVEGELGYIGSSSELRTEIPAGAAVDQDDLTKPEEALRFVRETGIDMLAPAVGNIHGMFANAPDPALDIPRIAAIKHAVNIPLVLHGGSGNSDEDFRLAISAGINVIHISTELRLAWRKGMEATLSANPSEVAPYKLMDGSIRGVEDVVLRKLKVFYGMSV